MQGSGSGAEKWSAESTFSLFVDLHMTNKLELETLKFRALHKKKTHFLQSFTNKLENLHFTQ